MSDSKIRYLTDTSEEILNLYYNAYLQNLRTFANTHETFWLSPLDIQMDFELKPINWVACNDPFLIETQIEPLNLAKDIIENGTYWHIYVLKNQNDEYCLRDGAHRLWGLKKLAEAGQIDPNFKLFALHPKLLNEGVEIVDCLIPTQVNVAFQIKYAAVYREFYNHMLSNKPQLDNNEVLIKIPINKKMMYLSCVMYAALLRDALYYNRNIKPSPIINDQKIWEEWLRSDLK